MILQLPRCASASDTGLAHDLSHFRWFPIFPCKAVTILPIKESDGAAARRQGGRSSWLVSRIRDGFMFSGSKSALYRP
jgi:hypothetical protein